MFSASLPPPNPLSYALFHVCMYALTHAYYGARFYYYFVLLALEQKKDGGHTRVRGAIYSVRVDVRRRLLDGWMYPSLICLALHTPTHFDLCISSPGSFDTVTMISLSLFIYHDL